MFAQLLALVLIVSALGAGAWGVLGGAVLASTAGMIDDDDARMATIRFGVAAALIGLLLFLAGAIGAGRMLLA